MINKKTWDEFQKSGLLWWVNRLLHTFGWVIVFTVEEDGTISEVYPARCKFRGFNEESEIWGFKNLHRYLKDNVEEIQKETEES